MTSAARRGFLLTAQAIRRQLTAMPHDLYLVRLIHNLTRRPFPGERLWNATQLLHPATVSFLRIRNREGCDVYLHPYADGQNAGYILLDLDRGPAEVLQRMRDNGHDPCVVLETSPGHLQAWIHVSASPLEPAMATAVARQLARVYGGDPGSADWRHLGRLAGFTNQKPARRTGRGYAPWIKILHAQPAVAPNAYALLQSVGNLRRPAERSLPNPQAASIDTAQAGVIYQHYVRLWRITQRFPQPDWSVVDLWVARHLLSRGLTPAAVQDIVRMGSPLFPRQHGNPDDYLRRTLARAALPFPPRGISV
jgi:RepB DNA-primase N-terminal domain/RepB DNA-primase C-terminal helical domain